MRTALALAILIAACSAASANDGVSVVIPGRPGVPIIINGIDASFAVIEGDWGLARGIHVQPTIYDGRFVAREPRVGHYYPAAGRRPGYGRLEVEPPAQRKLPPRAKSFHQSWSAQSAPPAPAVVPLNPPLVIEAAPDLGGSPSHPSSSRRGRNFRARP